MPTPIEEANTAHQELVSVTGLAIERLNAAIVPLSGSTDGPTSDASARLLNALAKFQMDLLSEIPRLIAELDFILRQTCATEDGAPNE